MSEQPENTTIEETQTKDTPRETVEWSFDFGELGARAKQFFADLAGDEELKTSTFSVSREAVASASIRLDYSVGRGYLTALAANSDLLLDAEIVHVGEMEFSEEGHEHKVVLLKQPNRLQLKDGAAIKRGLRAASSSSELRWDVQIAQNIPVRLDIDGGIGPTELDLSHINVEALDMDAGIGSVKLMLPKQEKSLHAEIESGMGQVQIFVPDNADVHLNIEGGVGAVEITVPANTAVQLRASTGIGSIHVPPTLTRLTKEEFMNNEGLWQSDGFELAERKVIIKYEGGIGQFTLHEAEVV